MATNDSHFSSEQQLVTAHIKATYQKISG
ncbi:Protein of unknown function [Leuconostoc citreum LBAE C10]|nr:Protein of unknown function [Leuconostoc citreum LBAE C10]